MSTETEMLTRLIDKQNEANAAKASLMEKRAAILQVAEDEGREDLTEDEDTEFRSLTAQIKTADEDIASRDERIVELIDEAKRADNAAIAARRAQTAQARISVGREARTYEKRNGFSYFQDLANARVNEDVGAKARLERHAIEVSLEPEYRDLDRTDGTGGYFVPPAWLMSEYVELARASRPTANLVRNLPLPPGTDSINVPKVSTGTATAIQTGDNQTVQETDLADTSVAAGVKTIAGQQDVALQALDQSPVAFDEIIFADLMADYNTKLDVQVINGSNASGQVKGILGASNINTETYTDTTPTITELYPKLAEAINKVHTTRYLPPDVIVMHPTRWAWMLAALDGSNRPFIVPESQGPFQSLGTFGGVVSQQTVGSILGLPVVTDPSVPNTLGTGTNEDRIIIMRSTDPVLYESAIKTRVLPDVGSGTLTVRLQVYGYLAFTAERQPKGITVVSGTGLSTPSF